MGYSSNVGVAPLGDPHIEGNGLKEYQNKFTANAVGAFIGRPHTEGNDLYKKECQTKQIANAVGVGAPDDP